MNNALFYPFFTTHAVSSQCSIVPKSINLKSAHQDTLQDMLQYLQGFTAGTFHNRLVGSIGFPIIDFCFLLTRFIVLKELTHTINFVFSLNHIQSSIMHHTRGVSTMVGRYPSCMVDTPHVWGVSKIRIPPMYGGYPPYKGGIHHTW